MNNTARLESSTHAADLAERVRVNQAKLTSELRSHYDFIVYGWGPPVPWYRSDFQVLAFVTTNPQVGEAKKDSEIATRVAGGRGGL